MKYEDIPELAQFEDIYQEKFLQMNFLTNDSYVIFIDGKNATANHKKDMFNDKGYTYNLMSSTKNILNDYNGKYHAYAILDEITIIFENGLELQNFLKEDKEDCALSLFTIMFYNEFKKYDDCLFKSYIYKIKKENIEKTINYRKIFGYYTALEYFAKEFLDKKQYVNCSVETIIENLKKANLYEKFLNLTQFHEGITYFYSNDWLDTLTELDMDSF